MTGTSCQPDQAANLAQESLGCGRKLLGEAIDLHPHGVQQDRMFPCQTGTQRVRIARAIKDEGLARFTISHLQDISQLPKIIRLQICPAEMPSEFNWPFN